MAYHGIEHRSRLPHLGLGVVGLGFALALTATAPWLPEWRRQLERGPISSWELETRLKEARFPKGAIQTAEPDPSGVCHDFALRRTSRQAPLCPGEVDLAIDSDYMEVREPSLGDLAVYRDSDGSIRHTGRVAAKGLDGLLLVESKWGSLGRYLHLAQVDGFSAPRFYRKTEAVPASDVECAEGE